jgi:uncharacterized membrane protein YagU involved in acid resistance
VRAIFATSNANLGNITTEKPGAEASNVPARAPFVRPVRPRARRGGTLRSSRRRTRDAHSAQPNGGLVNTRSDVVTASRPSPVVPIVVAGLIAGAIDLTFACSFHYLTKGVPPPRIFQAIASGWFGKDSYAMGATSATVGVVSHFAILIVAAAIFRAISRLTPDWRRWAYPVGALFGVGIYCTMNYIVLPLSAAPPYKPTSMLGPVCDFIVHVLLLGPAIALTLRAFDRRDGVR